MNPKLVELLDQVSPDGILTFTFFENADSRKALEKRDAPEFEKQWLRANKSLEELRQSRPVKADDLQIVDQVRENAYKRTFHLTNSPEFSAYVSDDFGLIALSLCFDHEDPWLVRLWTSYQNGIFPTGWVRI